MEGTQWDPWPEYSASETAVRRTDPGPSSGEEAPQERTPQPANPRPFADDPYKADL